MRQPAWMHPRPKRMKSPDVDSAVEFYKSPDVKVRPGDIVSLAPMLHALKSPLVHLGNEQTKSDRVHAELLGGTKGGPRPPPS